MKIANRIVINILGKKKVKDKDGDGVVDSKDCQPNNPMRQDVLSKLGEGGIRRLQNKMGTYKRIGEKPIEEKI